MIKKAKRGSQIGIKNNAYGTRWVYNLALQQNKKIKKDEVIPEGWLAGRKIKF